METRIIHNREVYINEDGKVIFDVDGRSYTENIVISNRSFVVRPN